MSIIDSSKIVEIKKEFPIFESNPKLIYLDNSATTQKPKSVINTISRYLSTYNSNVHRGLYDIAIKTDSLWEDAHKQIGKYINAEFGEIFFVRNATEGLNWCANTLGRLYLKKGDTLVLSSFEHHSNYLPWIFLQKEIGFEIKYIQVDDKGDLEVESLKRILDEDNNVRIVSVTHQSNVTGSIVDIEKIVDIARRKGVLTIVDSAQSIAHTKIDVKKIDCDALVFSGHKMYGPSGSGVVYCKKEILGKLDPWMYGGEMVKSVDSEISFSDLPYKFEAGTPAIESNIGLREAVRWLEARVDSLGGWNTLSSHYTDLATYASEKLSALKGLTVISSPNSVGVVTFVSKGVHPHDISTMLNNFSIAVRAGYHCAEPYHRSLGYNNGSIRISFGIYNTKEEIDFFVERLKDIISKFA